MNTYSIYSGDDYVGTFTAAEILAENDGDPEVAEALDRAENYGSATIGGGAAAEFRIEKRRTEA